LHAEEKEAMSRIGSFMTKLLNAWDEADRRDEQQHKAIQRWFDKHPKLGDAIGITFLILTFFGVFLLLTRG
jgi:hypothetical protein